MTALTGFIIGLITGIVLMIALGVLFAKPLLVAYLKGIPFFRMLVK